MINTIKKYTHKPLKLIFIISFVIISAISFPVYSFSMNTDLVNMPEMWYESNDFATFGYADSGDFNCQYGYCVDNECNCFYLYVSYFADELADYGNDVYLSFKISNDSNFYYFSVDKDGIVGDEFKKELSVCENFKAPTVQGQELLVGIEFLNKYDTKAQNSISISISFNGTRHNICNNVILDFSEGNEDSTSLINSNSKETEKSPASEKTTAKADSAVIITTSSTDKSIAETTTKFKYTPLSTTSSGNLNYSSTQNSNATENEKLIDNNESIIGIDSINDCKSSNEYESITLSQGLLTAQKQETAFSLKSAIFLTLSAISFTLGLVLIALDLQKRKVNKSNQEYCQ